MKRNSKRMECGRRWLVALVALTVLVSLLSGCRSDKKPTESTTPSSTGGYQFENPNQAAAEPDTNIKLDGRLDEKVYQDSQWLYLHNNNGKSTVDLAMTSWYGEKGMYFVFDVTENTPIYVNPERTSFLNSGIELYLATSDSESMNSDHVFEIDLQADGNLQVKKRDGYGFSNVATSADKMARLAATTKGGAVNTEDCYGYNLEFFIPWGYLESFGISTESVKNGFVYVDAAHITSYNFAGTDYNVDRYWYSFATQRGAGWGEFTKYFRFNADGVMDTVPVTLVAGDHYTISGSRTVIPEMYATVTITPDSGYALKSILVNGKETIQTVSYLEDGTVLLTIKGTADGLTVSAVAEAVTEGDKELRGSVTLNKVGGDSLKGIIASYKGPGGEKPITLDKNGRFNLGKLKQGYYTISVEKPGYGKLSRSVFLNKDMDIALALDYNMFVTEKGSCWDLRAQNDGILYRTGYGTILTANAYDSFYVEGYFRFDKNLVKQGSTDGYTQQRLGFRVDFDNGSTWHPALLCDNGQYIIQYGKVTENALFNWTKVHTLTNAEAEKYVSASGIKYAILRVGQYVNLFLDDKLVAIEDLGEDFRNCKARFGFESFVSNTDAKEMRYLFRTENLPQVQTRPIFTDNNGWELSESTNGVISLPNGGWANAAFNRNFTDMDLTIRVLDHPNAAGETRSEIRLEFANGKKIAFDVLGENGKVYIQCAGWDESYLQAWNNLGALNDREVAQYRTAEGIDFRVVRRGTEFFIFVGNRLAKVVDLSGEIQKNTAMTVRVLHWDDKGTNIRMPFSVTDDLSGSGLPNLKDFVFTNFNGWDVSGQNKGYITLPSGGWGSAEFVKKFTNLDLTVRVMDHPDGTVDPRNQIHLAFANGKKVTFDVLSQNGTVFLQSFGDSGCLMPWWNHGSLTEEEIAQYQTAEGVDFRIVRNGTVFHLLIGDRLVKTLDLSNEIAADTEVTVSIRHWDDNGAALKVPFAVKDTLDPIKLTVSGADNGTVTVEGTPKLGDDAVLNIIPYEGYMLSELVVNGENMIARLENGKLTIKQCLNAKISVVVVFTEKPVEYTVTGVVSGVTSGGTKLTIPQGTTVGFVGNGSFETTVGENGAYQVQLPAGEYVVSVDGYLNVTLTVAEGDQTSNLTLQWRLFAPSEWVDVSKDESTLDFVTGKKDSTLHIDAERFVLQYHATGVAGGNFADGFGLRVRFNGGNRIFQFGYIDGGYALRITDQWSGAYKIPMTENDLTTKGIDIMVIRDGKQFSAYYRLDAESNWVKAGATIELEPVEFSFYCWTTDFELSEITYAADLEPLTVTVDKTVTGNGTVTVEGTPKLGDDVVLNTVPQEGYVLSAITVNGEDAMSRVTNGKIILQKYMKTELAVVATFAERKEVDVSFAVVGHKNGSVLNLPSVTLVNVADAAKTYTVTSNNGRFEYANVAVGTYTVKAEGYLDGTVTVTKLGVAADTKITLEYDLLTYLLGWAKNEHDFSRQNDGIVTMVKSETLNVITKDSFDDVYITLNIQKDKVSGNHQQAVGLKFSNGKFMLLVLKEGGGRVYAEWQKNQWDQLPSAIDAWIPAEDPLSAEHLAKWESADGLNVTVARRGGTLYVLMDSKLVKSLALPEEYRIMKAQACFYAFGNNATWEFELGTDVGTLIGEKENQHIVSVHQNQEHVMHDALIPIGQNDAFTMTMKLKYIGIKGADADANFFVGNAQLKFNAKKNGDTDVIILRSNKSLTTGNLTFNSGSELYNAFLGEGVYVKIVRRTGETTADIYLGTTEENMQYVTTLNDVGNGAVAKCGYGAWGFWGAGGGNTAATLVIEDMQIMKGYASDAATVTVEPMEYGTVTPDKTYFQKNAEDVVLTITPENGYKLASIKVNGEEKFDGVTDGKLTLTNVPGDITVTATFVERTEADVSFAVVGHKNGSVVNLPSVTLVNVADDTKTYTVTSNDGRFVYANVAVGTYMVKADRYFDGTVTVTNTGVAADTQVTLEYDLMGFILGWGDTKHDFSRQNEGIISMTEKDTLNVLTKDSFGDVYITLNMQKDKVDGSHFQAVGLKFSNGKFMMLVVKEQGGRVYAEWQKDSDWSNMPAAVAAWIGAQDPLSAENRAKWESADGLNVTVARRGGTLYVLMDGGLVHTVLLPEEYCTMTAQAGFYSFGNASSWKFELGTDVDSVMNGKWQLFNPNGNVTVSADGSSMNFLENKKTVGVNMDAEKFVLQYHVTGVPGGNFTDGFGLRLKMANGNRIFQFGYIDGGYALRITDQWSGAYKISITEAELTTKGIDVKIVRNGNQYTAYYSLDGGNNWTQAGNTLELVVHSFEFYCWSKDFILSDITYRPGVTD